MASIGDILGKAMTSIIGLMIIGFAVFCAVFVLRSEMEALWAYAFGLACSALLAFLGLTITVAPWRAKPVGEGQQG